MVKIRVFCLEMKVVLMHDVSPVSVEKCSSY